MLASQKGRKTIGWTRADAVGLKSAWLQTLPESINKLVLSDKWRGGPIIPLSAFGAKAKDVEKNFPWVKGVFMCYPTSVPSAFLLADALLELNCEWNLELLKPPEVQPKLVALTPGLPLLHLPLRLDAGVYVACNGVLAGTQSKQTEGSATSSGLGGG
jgi:hypothetical protein